MSESKTSKKTEVELLKAEMLEMKELIKTMGQVTANNAKAIKGGKVKAKAEPPSIAIRPRAAELAILRDFLEAFQGQLSYDKDLCGKICLNLVVKPNVDALNEIINRQGELHKKAVEVGLYTGDDFKTIKINNK